MADQTTSVDLPLRVEQLTQRFWNLSAHDFGSDGFHQIAVGLQAVLDDMQAREAGEDKVIAVVEALEQLAQVLFVEKPAAKPLVGLERFVAAFRAEAQKRLAGLSISMMGVFHTGRNEDAVRQSTEHLHAIRGGAGMLGLRDIAQLAGAMEDYVHALARTDHRESTSAKSLLRAFAVLSSTITEPDEPADAVIEDVVEDLRAGISRMEKPRPRAEKEDTSVHTRLLEQRILVVDDVETIAASVGFVLSELDVPVDVVHDAREALKMLHERPYSLVVSDVNMPGMDGIALVEAMRRDDLLSDVPVILLTSLERPEERARGLAAGADDYIVKGSIGGGELIARVNERLLDAPYVPTVAQEVRHILVVEDTETIAASIAFVLSEGPYEIVLAHDGQDALFRMKRRSFDLVLSDIEMPSMNGIELVRAMRQTPELADIPVVMLTARGSDEHRAEAMAAGANRFLRKGDVAGGELKRVVAELLESP